MVGGEIDELVELTVREKVLKNKIDAMKKVLQEAMESADLTRVETKKGLAFTSSGSSVRVDKKAVSEFEKFLEENGITPDIRYKRNISYVRVYPEDEIPVFTEDDFKDMDIKELIDEIIKLSAEKKIISMKKKELSKKVLAMLKKYGKTEEYSLSGHVKVIEYQKEFIDTEKIKEYAETFNYPLDKIMKKTTYSRFVVIDWSAYQEMIEHADSK